MDGQIKLLKVQGKVVLPNKVLFVTKVVLHIINFSVGAVVMLF